MCTTTIYAQSRNLASSFSRPCSRLANGGNLRHVFLECFRYLHLGSEEISVALPPKNYFIYPGFHSIAVSYTATMPSPPINGQAFDPKQRQWIGNRLDHFVFTASNKTQYQVSHKILERQDPEPYYGSMEREAVAIYELVLASTAMSITLHLSSSKSSFHTIHLEHSNLVTLFKRSLNIQ